MQMEFTHGNLLLNVIYRPPPSNTNGLTSKLFLSDFSDFLETIIQSQSKLVIAGDFLDRNDLEVLFNLDKIQEIQREQRER